MNSLPGNRRRHRPAWSSWLIAIYFVLLHRAGCGPLPGFGLGPDLLQLRGGGLDEELLGLRDADGKMGLGEERLHLPDFPECFERVVFLGLDEIPVRGPDIEERSLPAEDLAELVHDLLLPVVELRLGVESIHIAGGCMETRMETRLNYWILSENASMMDKQSHQLIRKTAISLDIVVYTFTVQLSTFIN